jgi:hypothetical protein
MCLEEHLSPDSFDMKSDLARAKGLSIWSRTDSGISETLDTLNRNSQLRDQFTLQNELKEDKLKVYLFGYDFYSD